MNAQTALGWLPTRTLPLSRPIGSAWFGLGLWFGFGIGLGRMWAHGHYKMFFWGPIKLYIFYPKTACIFVLNDM